jgi:hypothetical protein
MIAHRKPTRLLLKLLAFRTSSETAAAAARVLRNKQQARKKTVELINFTFFSLSFTHSLGRRARKSHLEFYKNELKDGKCLSPESQQKNCVGLSLRVHVRIYKDTILCLFIHLTAYVV